ncbi:1,4-alpha-glucan branching enzyme [Alkalispirochaeta americana]|uniref:1,4-alpha-glucan branching enzyme n=1 Tax=Alkalispirochaeta americana TaxID=159291 RepID=A0A1N6PJT4_9SPIO|nr:1,4-alpha-glucan branching protein domain-containing protein [Alkalispirochaeta americana]SIQ04557.1 1,4-alpha-glucan branching enzyme [Alkalispirochaeta americana]
MGKSILILHSHLPLVRHPEYETFLEERWLFEAISETYLPLLRMMHRLDTEGIPSPMAMCFSPTLSFMLQDPLLMERYGRFLDKNIELAEQELDRTAGEPAVHSLARMYHSRYTTDREELHSLYGGNILKGFDRFARKGTIELIATAATHAFLPNYRSYSEVVRCQVELGVESHTKHFGRPPRGFWLPECGYYEGLDRILADAGVEYFVGAAHGVLFGEPSPDTGTYAPLATKAGVAVFPRDVYTATWVWSSNQGYPTNPSYRDFYRDIGYDLPLEQVGPFIHDGNVRIDTGFKYHAITGPTDDKELYDQEAGRRKAREHARDFYTRQKEHSARLGEVLSAEPVITSPFDTELFGHWWFEGPQWLEELFRVAHEDQQECVKANGAEGAPFSMTTPSSYLDEFGPAGEVAPTFSSWGSGGYAQVWMDGTNDWLYRHTHQAVERMAELVARFPDESGLKERALNQAAREVLLAMASDWPFIMNARTVVTYAERRVKEHLYNFTRVYAALSQRNMGTEWLTRLEKKHPLFPDLNYRRMKRATTEALRDLI